MTASSPARAIQPRFSACGSSALLMDVAAGAFDLDAQKHLWSLAAAGSAVHGIAGVRGVVLGVNNMLVRFDPLAADPRELHGQLQSAWQASGPLEATGRLVEVPVAYDMRPGSELEALASHARLEVAEVIRLHTSADYHVAAIGSVPGFPYLVGLPPQLAMPRHQTPRAKVLKGSVAIGGAQAGIIPMDMPSGWNVLGFTDLELFDPLRAQPSLLAPGDRLRFVQRRARP
ncbi:MAG TPA: 5-oxoprolinase subunit PxpB [Ramlibacter sp.]